jgi:5-formyltetrahydrofolate cyclo-ligase
MNPESARTKQELRRRLRSEIRALPGAAAAAASVAAQKILRQQRIWQQARTVLFYAPLPGEIDLVPLLAEAVASGKAAALPRFDIQAGTYNAAGVKDLGRDCAPGKFGILEPKPDCPPISLKQLDLVLVPGLGFDETGHRLGRGQGFYDRLLAEFSGIKCGVARDEQLLRNIPGEAHDVRMNFILTPTRWLEIFPS